MPCNVCHDTGSIFVWWEFDLCLSKVMHGRHGEGVYMESFGVNKPCVFVYCEFRVVMLPLCVCVCVNCAHQSFLCEVHVIVSVLHKQRVKLTADVELCVNMSILTQCSVCVCVCVCVCCVWVQMETW